MRIYLLTSFFTIFLHSALLSQTLVKDIFPGSKGSTSKPVCGFGGNKIFLFANDSTHGEEIWTSDGTSLGTVLLKDINPGTKSSSPGEMIEYNGKYYFTATDGASGNELWVTDGTTTGTSLFMDIFPGAGDAFGSPSPAKVFGQFKIYNGNLYFLANDGVHGAELWVSNGTQIGTKMLMDIWPGPKSGGGSHFAVVKGRLVFKASDSTHGLEYWITDGTSANTKMITDVFPGVEWGIYSYAQPFEFNNVAYTIGIASQNENYELYKIDTNVVSLVKNINTTSNAYSTPCEFNVAGGKLFFCAIDPIYGRELHTTDGTSGGTKMVKDMALGGISSLCHTIGEINGKLIFEASCNDGTGKELWVSDGTDSGTNRIVEVYPGPDNGIAHLFSSEYASLTSSPFSPKNGPYIKNQMIIDGYYYFAGNDGVNGLELWRTDGTKNGTQRISQMGAGSVSSSLDWIFGYNGALWLRASDGNIGMELFHYKPTVSVGKTTFDQQLKIYPNPAQKDIYLSKNGLVRISDVNGKVIFISNSRVESIDVSDFKKGLYFLMLTGQDFTESRTFIIE